VEPLPLLLSQTLFPSVSPEMYQSTPHFAVFFAVVVQKLKFLEVPLLYSQDPFGVY
jgi:hypothetical protein